MDKKSKKEMGDNEIQFKRLVEEQKNNLIKRIEKVEKVANEKPKVMQIE